jgi:hypothetical protein
MVSSVLSSLSYGRVLGNVAAACVMFLGVIAALGQAEIATTITGPVLVAVLATVAGVIIVGVGGGMVRPMQERWERMLGTAEREVGNVRTATAGSTGARGAMASGNAMPMPGASSSSAASSGEAYTAGRSDAAAAAEEAARRARQNPPTGSGGGMSGDDRGGV